MRRFAVGAAGLFLALTLAASALAGGRSFDGDLSAGTISFRIENHRLSSFKFLSVPIACKSGGETASGRDATDSFPVDNGGFDVNLHATNSQFTGRISLSGQLSGRSASGTFRLRGRRVPIDGAATGHHCDTGKLRWTAD